GRMESHPQNPDPYWQMEAGNLGLELMQARNVPDEKSPVTPPNIAGYLAGESRRVDLTYWLGNQRTSPIRMGDKMVVYFDKTVLEYPASALDGADDPAAVKRQPVGTI